MIKRNDARSHFNNLLTASKIDIPDMNGHINRAIDMGFREFWGAWNWSFKSAEIELSLTTSADSYDLPVDFESFRTFREKTTNSGLRLIFKPKEVFDRMVPDLSAYNATTPQMFTIFRDAKSDTWKVRFYPKPEASTTIYCDIFLTTPTNFGSVPDRCEAALLAIIAKHVYPYDHPTTTQIAIRARGELLEAIRRDKVDGSDPVEFLDSTHQQIYTDRPWL